MERPAHNGLGVSASLTGSTNIHQYLTKMSNRIEFVPAMKEALKEVFGYYVSAEKMKGGIEIDAGSTCTVTYVMLQKLSEIFATTKIDVNSNIVRGGYCETCEYEETVIKIQVFESSHEL